MQVDCIAKRAAMLAGVAVALVIVTSFQRHTLLLLFNRTPSLPTGWYVYHGSMVHRGDVVAFMLPTAVCSYARLRGDSANVLLLKHVLAVRGDFVSTMHSQLRVNGVLIGPIAAADSAGRPLPQWSAARFLTGDELLVGSTNPRSFDSRYFGPIHASQVLGVYRKLTLRLPFASLPITQRAGPANVTDPSSHLEGKASDCLGHP